MAGSDATSSVRRGIEMNRELMLAVLNPFPDQLRLRRKMNPMTSPTTSTFPAALEMEKM